MELIYESSIEKLSREKKVIFEPGVKFFYKFDYAPEEIWINKEILVQLYYKELDIVYRINLTGGDIFYYYKIEELLILLRDLEYVIAVDLLINRFWNNKTKYKLSEKKLVNKIVDISIGQFLKTKSMLNTVMLKIY